MSERVGSQQQTRYSSIVADGQQTFGTMESKKTPSRSCFVTIGATASFDGLLSAIFEGAFLEALRDANYTDLLVQYGQDGKAIFDKFTSENAEGSKERFGLNITGFDFNSRGLGQEMREAKSDKSGAKAEGMVISHAGSGSILDALRIGVPLIVVPNPKLLDNHQIELAKELSAQGYVVHGKLDDLPAAIAESEALRTRMHGWPPINSGEEKYKRGLAGVMADEMGFTD